MKLERFKPLIFVLILAGFLWYVGSSIFDAYVDSSVQDIAPTTAQEAPQSFWNEGVFDFDSYLKGARLMRLHPIESMVCDLHNDHTYTCHNEHEYVPEDTEDHTSEGAWSVEEGVLTLGAWATTLEPVRFQKGYVLLAQPSDYESVYVGHTEAGLLEYLRVHEPQEYRYLLPEATAEQVDSLHSVLEVGKDGKLVITEYITYNFGPEERHGIYRYLEHKRAPGSLRAPGVRVLSVTDDTGSEVSYTIEHENGFTTDKTVIKIGDPYTTITGRVGYIISYEVTDAIGYYGDFNEVYWNTTGHAWEVPIVRASAEVNIPAKVPDGSVRFASYCGSWGSKQPCVFEHLLHEPKSDTTRVFFSGGSQFSESNSGVGMTVAVGFPKGIVPEPPLIDRLFAIARDWWFLLFPIVVIPLWFKRDLTYALVRRGYYRNNPLVTEFDPGEWTPLEAAALIRGYIHTSDVTAHIIWLATQGYLTIDQNEGDYAFARTQKETTGLDEYSVTMLEALDGKTLSGLSGDFHAPIKEVVEEVIGSLRLKGYFLPEWRSDKAQLRDSVKFVKRRWNALILGVFFSINPGLFIWIFAGVKMGAAFSATAIVIGIITCLWSPRSINRLSAKGLEAERKLLGLRRYIDAAEEERIAFHSDPAKDPKTFERLLPYAMVFELEEKWAAQFASAYTTVPEWYHGSGFSSTSFTSAMRTTATLSLASALTPITASSSGFSGGGSGSSGGGSSGGGGGGGGGGSW